jgi:hypothetical protein
VASGNITGRVVVVSDATAGARLRVVSLVIRIDVRFRAIILRLSSYIPIVSWCLWRVYTATRGESVKSTIHRISLTTQSPAPSNLTPLQFPYNSPCDNCQNMGQNTSRLSRNDPNLPRVPRDIKFRVLIIGRANAGKTTILQKVCETTESPEIYRRNRQGRRERVRSRP